MSDIISRDYWRWVARGDIGRIPAVFAPVERFKRSFNPAYRDLAVCAATDLVIEGFPRCGNTFAAQAIQLLKPGLKIACRCHSYTQIAGAVRFGKPCVILLRTPLECLVSAWIHADGKLSFRFLARHYLRFYRNCRKLQQHVIISDFATTTDGFDRLVRALNRRWHLGLPAPPADAQGFSTSVFAAIDGFYRASRRTDRVHQDRVSRPSLCRNIRKAALHDQAQAAISPALLAACDTEYAGWKNLSV